MHVWVAGSTGLVGRALLAEVVARPEVDSVTALVRRAEGSSRPKLEEQVVDFEKLELELAGRTVTHVFCCLGTTMAKAKSQAAFRRVDYDYPLALGRAALAAGAEKYLVVTALGADPASRVFYNRVKGELEVALRGLGLRELHVFRPSLLLGERRERRAGERVAAAVARPLGPLMLGPLEKYRPIAGADVAKAMLRVALGPKAKDAVSVYESQRIAEIARGP